MKRPFAKAPMSCQQFVELVTAYLDRSLSRRLQQAIDAHLEGCTECSEYLAQMRLTAAVVGRLAEVPPIPAELLDRLAAAFAEASEVGLSDGQEP